MSMAALRGPARYRAWAVPAVLVVVLAGGGWLATTGTASGHPRLPSLTPAQLLAKIETARAPSLTGTVTETARLGLPDLPGSDQSASLSWTSLISGSHTARVWLDGVSRQRIAILGTLSEAEIVHNGRDVWTYTSTSNQVSHTVLPATAGDQRRHASSAPGLDATTPIGVADTVLKAIDPTTSVTVDPTQIVAGHDAYTIVIKPRDDRSTIREVTIAVDGKKFVPLQVQVFGASSTPALDIGFSRLSFSRPKASVFDFHAPSGAAVVGNPLQQRDYHRAPSARDAKQQPAISAAKPAAPKLIGSGWTAVVELPSGLPAGMGAGLLDRLPAPAGANGARTLTTALINAVMLPDGRMFIGAVATSLLEHIAATTPR